MGLRVYNTITNGKEEFQSITPERVGMYVCGPTVYGMPHVGHAKSYICFDIVRRYLEFSGYRVKYVQNITDIGHLVGDADDGDDKIQKQAQIEKLDPVEIAYRYECEYFTAMDRLNILRPSISCRATGHIIEIQKMIQKFWRKAMPMSPIREMYISTFTVIPITGSCPGGRWIRRSAANGY